MPGELHLGVDVGGTNTDAVIIDQRGTLIAKAKVATVPDVRQAIEQVIGLATEGRRDPAGLPANDGVAAAGQLAG